MESFAITVKEKIILQNIVTSNKLTFVTNIRILPNLMKVAQFLKMKLLFICPVSNKGFTPFDLTITSEMRNYFRKVDLTSISNTDYWNSRKRKNC